MAQGAQGVICYHAEVTPGSTSTAIGEVVGWSGPAYSAGVIDITHLQSSVKEKITGVYDPGEISFDINFMGSGNVGQKSLRTSLISRVKSGIIIQLSTATTTQKIRCKGYITGFSVQGAVDQVVKGSVTIALSGPVTWTT